MSTFNTQDQGRRLPFFQIDAFALRPFEGNPAAVCLLDGQLDDGGWAQQLAAEMNLSETAFVEPASDAGTRKLRWFTPDVEVDLCGHATLASAHALFEMAENGGSQSTSGLEPIRFDTRSGILTATPIVVDGERLIELDFPARAPRSCEPPDGLLEGLGLMPRWIGRSGEDDYVVEVDSVAFVRELVPDLRLLAAVSARGIIVTARVGSNDQVPLTGQSQRPDFVSRFFGPAVGVPEDPVTGSAHCALAPYWASRLKSNTLLGYQASPRGGFVGVEVREQRVALQGSAVTVVRGELVV